MAHSTNATALTVPEAVIVATTSETLERYRPNGPDNSRYGDRNASLKFRDLDDETLADLLQAADSVGEKSFGRLVTSLIAGRTGKPVPIARIGAAVVAIQDYLRQNMIDGWVYVSEEDGFMTPYLVTSLTIVAPRNQGDTDTLVLELTANGAGNSLGVGSIKHSWAPSEVTKKTPEAVLASKGIYKETPEFKEDYERALARYITILTTGFTQQYRFNGTVRKVENWRDEDDRSNRKVVHDIAPREVPGSAEWAETPLLGEDQEARVPTVTTLRVFDLTAHNYVWVNTQSLTDYVYDKSLREKLVLPNSHRDLLDILTSDIDTFTSDIIEGKSAGNVILCKGQPGVGKTLSAEVYSELIERPLYSIHSGSLGITAVDVRENLEKIFKRSKRLNLVLLLDEADVFVLERGRDLSQNAIVAEFLRTMEYFDGLLFMTTNRSQDIDDAILSRAAAIIDFDLPDRADAAKVWKVQAANNGITLDPTLLEEVLDHLPTASPRDIKMLLRLALRVTQHEGTDLTLDTFRRCAMFRSVTFQEPKSAQ